MFPNQLGPGDTVGALTYVRALQEHVGGDIEVVSVRTLGVKNLDVEAALRNKDLPTEVSCGARGDLLVNNTFA